MSTNLLTEQVFDLITLLTASDKQKVTNQATRLVLIHGMTQAEARRQLAMKSRSSLSESIKNYLQWDVRIREAYGLDGSTCPDSTVAADK